MTYAMGFINFFQFFNFFHTIRFQSKKFFQISAKAALAIAALVLASCATGAPVDSWGDAGVIAEQKRTIDEQRERISELERVIQSGAEHLREAEERLGSLEDGNLDFERWLKSVDAFIRAVIDEQRKLEGIQRTDREPDAGAG